MPNNRVLPVTPVRISVHPRVLSDLPDLPKNPFPKSFVKEAKNGMKFRFVKTSDCAPLQYDVFHESGKKCGYVRFRNATLTVCTPDLSETMVEIIAEDLEMLQEEWFVEIAAETISRWYEAVIG